MTMQRDVFLALLAMDAYNRGYGASVSGLGESGKIGGANILSRTSIFGSNSDQVYQQWQATGFYAIAYQWGAETVVAYRKANSRRTTSPRREEGRASATSLDRAA